MNAWMELAAFAGVMALGQFSPGPDMILLTRTSLAQGAKAGVFMACGIASGLTVHATIAVGGLALAFERVPALRVALSWLAAAYLVWLAGRLLAEHFLKSSSGGTVGNPAPAAKFRHHPYIRGLICNLLNPKAALFLAAVSAPFLAGPREPWWPAAIWCVVVFQAAFLWALWARLLQWPPLRRRYEGAAKWIDSAFAAALVALAARLVWPA